MIGRAAIAGTVIASLLLATPAHALTPNEKARLARGETLAEPTTYHRNGGRFVGGVSYRIVDADAARLSAMLRTPKTWASLLPRVSDVSLLAVEKNGHAHLRITHAFGPFRGAYEVVLAFTDQGRYGRFWVNRTADNDLVDGWGFVRLTPLPMGKTLVTWAVLFDLGDGVTRSMFESKMQRAALDVPRRLSNAAAS